IRDFPARLSPVISSCEQRVVLCLHVPDVRPHGQADRLLVKTLGGGRSPDPATIFQTSVFGDSWFTSCGTARKEFSYSFCKTLYIHLVQFFSPNGFALSAPRSDFLVGQTFFFRFFQCRLFNEQSLPFIPFARATPFQNDSAQRRVLLRTPSQCSIARGQKQKMIQIGTGET